MNRNTKKLLVVDDDAKLRELLQRYLTEQQFEVALAGDATAMNRLMQREAYDLIILDQMLPGEDGLSIIRRLRASSDRTPIIMLTAKGDDVDRIIGLEMGADDYLPKPFNPRELVARVRAVLRRTRDAHRPRAVSGRRYRFAGWELDAGSRELVDPQGHAIELTGGEFDLLVALLDHPQRVLTRDQLLDWTRGRDAAPYDRTIGLAPGEVRRCGHGPLRIARNSSKTSDRFSVEGT